MTAKATAARCQHFKHVPRLKTAFIIAFQFNPFTTGSDNTILSGCSISAAGKTVRTGLPVTGQRLSGHRA